MQARGLDRHAGDRAPGRALRPDPRSAASTPAPCSCSATQDRLTYEPYGRLPTGQPLVLTDERASSGGPTPTGAAEPLALRQRILAEAALDLVRAPADRGALPDALGAGALLARGRLLRGPDASVGAPRPRAGRRRAAHLRRHAPLRPRAARRRDRARPTSPPPARWCTRATCSADLLANVNDVHDRLTGAALQGSAYSARPTPQLAADQVRALDAHRPRPDEPGAGHRHRLRHPLRRLGHAHRHPGQRPAPADRRRPAHAHRQPVGAGRVRRPRRRSGPGSARRCGSRCAAAPGCTRSRCPRDRATPRSSARRSPSACAPARSAR